MPQPQQAPSGRYWWVPVFWLAIGLIMAAQLVVPLSAARIQFSLVAFLFTNVAAWLLIPLATPGILLLARRFPLTAPESRTKNLLVHVSAALAIGIVHVLWYSTLEWFFNPRAVQPELPFRRVLMTAVMIQFHTAVILYAVIVAIGSTIESIRRLAQRDAQLAKARLDALRRQLEPHFLFNTLNGIAGLVREQRNEDAVEMIAGLSDLLRRVVEDSDRQLVPVAEEAAFLESYLKLQTMRFGDRLKVAVDIPLDLYGALVPPLVLQPLVENAIVHGIGKRIEGGEIRVTLRECQGVLSISLYNDGPVLGDSGSNKAGVGLSNTRGRLAALYGPGSSVELRNGPQAGVETIITLPYRTVA